MKRNYLKPTIVFLLLTVVFLFGKYMMTGEIISKSHAMTNIAGDSEKKAFSKALDKKYKHLSQSQSEQIVNLVYKHTQRHNIPLSLGLAIIAVESNFNSKAKSPTGSSGYTQIQPRWHRDKIKGRNIFNPEVNIEVGMQILSDCMKNYSHQKGVLGCYNGSYGKKKMYVYSSKVLKVSEEISKLAYEEIFRN